MIFHTHNRGDEMAARDLAPGWKIRCLKCGFTEDFGKYGVRLWGAGKPYTVGWCARCRWIRCHVIEKDAKSKRH
jgi:hypothetical protein